MVAQQIESRGVRDPRVLDALRRVPRHCFLPEGCRSNAYGDFPISIGEAQTISQPYMVALMTETLELEGDERVLEIGTGSGYQTAVLAELCSEVHTVERLKGLHETAQATLAKLGYEHVRCHWGDGTLGWPDQAPYDRILVTAGAPSVPAGLADQMDEDGILVIPVGDRGVQMLRKYVWTPRGLMSEDVCSCVFVPLRGAQGWPEQD